MKKIFVYAVLFASLLTFNSCTSPVCITSSITPMQGKVIAENLGRTDGTDSAFSVFGLYMIGRPDLDMAIKDALQKKGGDTLINVRCYETNTWLVLLGITTVRVEGEAVRFSAEASDSKDRKKDKKK